MADAIEDDYPNPDIRENGDLILYEIATDKLDPSERPIVTWSKFTPGVAHLTRDAKIAIRRFMLTEKYFRKGVGSVASRSRKEWSNLLADSGLDDPDVNQIARDAVKQAMEKEVISVSENWMKSGIWGLGELFTSKSSPQKHDRDGNPKLSKVTLNPVVQHLMNNAEEWKKWDGEFPELEDLHIFLPGTVLDAGEKCLKMNRINLEEITAMIKDTGRKLEPNNTIYQEN